MINLYIHIYIYIGSIDGYFCVERMGDTFSKNTRISFNYVFLQYLFVLPLLNFLKCIVKEHFTFISRGITQNNFKYIFVWQIEERISIIFCMSIWVVFNGVGRTQILFLIISLFLWATYFYIYRSIRKQDEEYILQWLSTPLVYMSLVWIMCRPKCIKWGITNHFNEYVYKNIKITMFVRVVHW